MGNLKSKQIEKPGKNAKFFDRVRYNKYLREKKLKTRKSVKGPTKKSVKGPVLTPAPPSSAPAPANLRSYDDEAIDRMRYELRNDSDAFLLNNILLSVQFFENYERETQHIRNNPTSDRELLMNEAMIRRHKHIFFADRLQDCVHEHVVYKKGDQLEPLIAPRYYVVYDNIEAGISNVATEYSSIIDAPIYKLQIKDNGEPGYVQLQKLEVVECTKKENETSVQEKKNSGDSSMFSESGKESVDSDDCDIEVVSDKIETILPTENGYLKNKKGTLGPLTRQSSQIENKLFSNHITKKAQFTLVEKEEENSAESSYSDNIVHSRKSILKVTHKSEETSHETKIKKFNTHTDYADEDTETSGYRSTNSSKQNESETESEYSYVTITKSATPRKIALIASNRPASASGLLPDECWYSVKIKTVDMDTINNNTNAKLFKTVEFLSSTSFMVNFINNFFVDLGSGLGLTKDDLENALTQGASIYCDTLKNGAKVGCEIYPALSAAWPVSAYPWLKRERKIVMDPRTNSQYQWPTGFMVDKAEGFGSFLIPIGCRSKRGKNPSQVVQWRIVFPEAERYLESCLAHSHIRCYLFSVILHKTFMENKSTKLGVDSSHLKNHLFWQCEKNYARWPEDRLGEALRTYLKKLFVHCERGKLPNYFIDTCNDFQSIPGPILLAHLTQLRDILEAPVMHLLHALDRIKYTDEKFYPRLDCRRLYELLTTKSSISILNPNIPQMVLKRVDSSDSEEEYERARDKQYIWNKKKQDQLRERRRIYSRQQKPSKKIKEINPNIRLPQKMEIDRRLLVLEFFIGHFIAMASSSEKFEATKQAIIYLEQAQRLCVLLKEEHGDIEKVNNFSDIIRDKLTNCRRKLVEEISLDLPPRPQSAFKMSSVNTLRNQANEEQVKYSPVDYSSISPFTFVDVHIEPDNHASILHFDELGQESKL